MTRTMGYDWSAPGPASVEWTSWQALGEALREWRGRCAWRYMIFGYHATYDWDEQRMRHDRILMGHDDE